MRCALLVSLLTLASASALIEPRKGYHDAVGIPAAERVKKAEDSIAEPTRVHNAVVDERIVGGVISPAQAHPHLAGLIISLVGINGVSVCGSSLLSPSRLVTAAHCWADGHRQAWRFEVVLGSQFVFFGGTRMMTSHVVTHPQWFPPGSLANDVAIVYLPTNVLFNHLIQPISLPSGSQLFDSFAGQWALASGYGKTSDLQTGVTTQTQISHVSLQVITVQACQAVFGSWWVQPTNICTSGAGGVGICGGDSGGPLVVNQNGQNILVGISSFVADAGCQLGFPSAFARITSFHSFITQHL